MDNLRLEELLNRHVDGTLDAGQQREMEQMLLGSSEARAAFWRFTRLHSRIRASYQLQAGRRLADGDGGGKGDRSNLPERPSGCFAQIGPVPFSAAPPAREPLVPPIIIDTTGHPQAALFSLGSSVGGWLFSYAAATVITGMAILGAWAYKVSLGYPAPVSTRPSGDPPVEKHDTLMFTAAGRITGMAGPKWSEDQQYRPLRVGATVPLGCRLDLAAGLLEVTYETGAKVILQGPCAYEVDSPSGGFLSLGRLTARVETKESPFRLPPSAFVVRTPTAVVTDLGTEFGVEVDRQGHTESHVFVGKVKVVSADALEDAGNGSSAPARPPAAGRASGSRSCRPRRRCPSDLSAR